MRTLLLTLVVAGITSHVWAGEPVEGTVEQQIREDADRGEREAFLRRLVLACAQKANLRIDPMEDPTSMALGFARRTQVTYDAALNVIPDRSDPVAARRQKNYNGCFLPAFTAEMERLTRERGEEPWATHNADSYGGAYKRLVALCKHEAGLTRNMPVSAGLKSLEQYRACMGEPRRWRQAQVISLFHSGEVPTEYLEWEKCLAEADFTGCTASLVDEREGALADCLVRGQEQLDRRLPLKCSFGRTTVQCHQWGVVSTCEMKPIRRE
jgi:hypothetical protein